MNRDKDYLIENIGELEEEEFDLIYEELDEDEQMEVYEAIRDFADHAVGDEHWRNDD